MSLKICNIFVLLMLFTQACKKDNYIVDMPPHTERKIVCEGNFTDSLMKHRFRFTLSNDIGSPNKDYVNNAELTLTTPDATIPFNSQGNGWFEAEEAFQGVYGENYFIQFLYNSTLHEVETVMPSPITVHNYIFQEPDSTTFLTIPIEIFMDVSSPVKQYLMLDIFYSDLNSDTTYTSWIKLNLPTYKLAEIPAGAHSMVRLPINKNDNFFLRNNRKLKIETSVITEPVANYLFELEDYISGKQANGQFYNPPYYFSNEGYGLVYGTLLDTITHEYSY